MENKSKKMYVELPIRVKTYDTDYMKIVSNTVYVKWFEDLRMTILDKYFPLSDMLKENKTPILSETHIKYKRPITLQNNPVGKAWVSDLGKSKWIINLEIWDNDVLYCEGEQTGYYFDMTTNRPTKFDEEFLEYYESL